MIRNSVLIILVLLTQIIFPQSTAAATPQPDITVNPTSVNFGGVPVSTNSTPMTVTITNDGSASLTICDITIVGTNDSQFRINSVNVTSNILPPGASASGTIIFRPTSLGTKKACLRIYSTDPDESPFIIALSGTGTAAPLTQPDISVNPASINSVRCR